MATVLIWNNHMQPSAHRYPGHAAMNISDTWHVGGGNKAHYVSWWPERAVGWYNRSTPASPNDNFVTDLEAEGYAPDHVIRINGLNVGQMRAAWAQIQGSGRYQMFRSGCATVVAAVLKAGGAGGGRHRHTAIWTPLKAKRLALAMGGNSMSYIDLINELSAGVVGADEAKLLKMLPKRDEKHGKSNNIIPAFVSQGNRMLDRMCLFSDNRFDIVAGGRTPIGEERQYNHFSATDMGIDTGLSICRVNANGEQDWDVDWDD